MYLLELTAYDIAAACERTLYFSDGGLTTAPDDTPANTWFAPRLAVPASFELSVYKDGVTGGASDGGWGEIELTALDGGLDYLADYALDGRRFVLSRTSTGRADAATVVMTGVVESFELTWSRLVLHIRDRKAKLEEPIQETLYAGTNNGPGGLEGDESLKGQEKPLCFGKCLNVTPAEVNASDRMYQVHDGAIEAVDAVYDKGAALEFAADYADAAALQAATFAAGQYATCLAEGLFRLWTAPAGDVTADIRGDAMGGYVDHVAGILERIVRERAGLVDADLALPDLAALAAAAPAEVGIYLGPGDSEDMDAVLDALCRSVGAWWAFDRMGVLRCGRFEAPAGDPAATFTTLEIRDREGVEKLPPDDLGNGVPIWRVSLSSQRNWTVQDKDRLAGVVQDDAERVAWLAEETRTALAEDAAVKTAHPLSPVLEVETLLTGAADAATEAARLLALYSTRRDRFNVQLKPKHAEAIQLGDVVELRLPRFGLSAGKLFTVLGLTLELEDDYVEVDLYG